MNTEPSSRPEGVNFVCLMNWMAFSTVEWISVNALVMANVKSTPNKNTTRYFQPDVREISFFFIAKRKDLKNHSIKNLQHTLEIEKKHQFSSHLYVDRKAKFLTIVDVDR